MTKTFENNASRAVEEATLACIRRAWNVKRWRDLRSADDPKPHAEFAIERASGEQAIVEIKGRNRAYLSAYSIEIAKAKIDRLLARSRRHGGVAAYLFFACLFDRSIWYVDVRSLGTLDTYFGGRVPRPGAANDQETMVSIPLGALLPLVGETLDGAIADAAIAYNREHRYG